MIPYGRQTIDDADIEAVVSALRSDWLTQGPLVDAFEQKIAEYCGARYAVAVANGTAGLHMAYAAAGIGPGDEVIVPAITFAATGNASLYLGAKPVFCDIRLDTYNIDETKIEALITSRTKAIVPVHLAGQACALEAIWKIAIRYNLTVIEDGCHALGGEYQHQKIGSLSALTVFSFHPVKSITTGEGGVVTTNNETLYQRMRTFRTHGITKDPQLLKRNDGPWYHEMQSLGFNYRLTDIQSALGIAQMKKLDSLVARRRELAALYTQCLAGTPGLVLPAVQPDALSSWHLYVIRVPAEKRLALVNFLKEQGIGTQVHYLPVYQHPFYRANGYADISLPNTEAYYRTCVSIPLYPSLSEDQVRFISETIRRFLITS